MESAVICAEPSPLTTRALSEPGSSRSANSPSSHANPPDTRSLASVKPASSGTSSVIDPLVESSAVCGGKAPASVTSSAPETLATERSVVTAPPNETDPLIEADRSSSCLPPPFVFTVQALTLLCGIHDVRDLAIGRDGKEHQEREGRGSHDGEHEPEGNHEDAVRERTLRPFSVPAARALGGLRNALARTRGRLRCLGSRPARLRRSRGRLGKDHACGVRAASISSASQSHQASMPCPRVALTSNRGAVGLRSSSVEP